MENGEWPMLNGPRVTVVEFSGTKRLQWNAIGSHACGNGNRNGLWNHEHGTRREGKENEIVLGLGSGDGTVHWTAFIEPGRKSPRIPGMGALRRLVG